MRNLKNESGTGGSNPPLSSPVTHENHGEKSPGTELSAVPNANRLPSGAVSGGRVPAVGDVIEVALLVDGDAPWVGARVLALGGGAMSGWMRVGEIEVDGALVEAIPLDVRAEGKGWRWPSGSALAVAEEPGDERDAMAAEAVRSLAARGLAPERACAQPCGRAECVPLCRFPTVPERPTTGVPAEHGAGVAPEVARPAASAPGVAAPVAKPLLSADGSRWLCPRCIGEAHRVQDAGVKSTVCTSRGAECWSALGWPPDPLGACAVRRCEVKEPSTAYEGRVLDACGTGLGEDVLCSVCGGGTPEAPAPASRCFVHCGSVDHFGGPLVMTTTIERWRLVLRASGRAFQGEVRELGAVQALKSFSGADSEQVIGEMMTFIDGLRNAPPKREPYAPPTVRELPRDEGRAAFARVAAAIAVDAIAQDRGDETCSAVDGFDPGEWHGITPHGMAANLPVMLVGSRLPYAARRTLSRQLQALAFNLNHVWGELEEADERVGFSDAVSRARALSDAAVCAVIALMAGGVR
jgi:hypothetical protein